MGRLGDADTDLELVHATDVADEGDLALEGFCLIVAETDGDVELGTRGQAIAGTGRTHGGDHATGELELALGILVHELLEL